MSPNGFHVALLPAKPQATSVPAQTRQAPVSSRPGERRFERRRAWAAVAFEPLHWQCEDGRRGGDAHGCVAAAWADKRQRRWRRNCRAVVFRIDLAKQDKVHPRADVKAFLTCLRSRKYVDTELRMGQEAQHGGQAPAARNYSSRRRLGLEGVMPDSKLAMVERHDGFDETWPCTRILNHRGLAGRGLFENCWNIRVCWRPKGR